MSDKFQNEAFERHRTRSEEVLKSYAFSGRSYFDAPEGEDLPGKLIASNRYAAALGLIYGLMGLAKRQYTPTKLPEMIILSFRPAAKMTAVTSAFTITTFYSTRLRKKDDEVNYVNGGAASGIMYGFLANSFGLGVASAFLGGILGYYLKDDLMKGKFFNTNTPSYANSYYQRKLNYSFVREREGKWKKEEPPVKV